MKLRFTYDAFSRRIRKQVWQEMTLNGTNLYALKVDRRFLYDGWNLIAEIDPDGSAARTYVWGTDLSGHSTGEAGGAGGLLMVNILKCPAGALGIHFPSYDVNGNIIALTGYSNGAETARYSYDAFGRELRASGAAAQVNPFHFSTKFTDEETGLCYCGYRYYNASSGRWLSRDPLGELGGLNLYGMLGNDPLNHVDVLGAASLADVRQQSSELQFLVQLANQTLDSIKSAQNAYIDYGKGSYYARLICDRLKAYKRIMTDIDAIRAELQRLQVKFEKQGADQNALARWVTSADEESAKAEAAYNAALDALAQGQAAGYFSEDLLTAAVVGNAKVSNASTKRAIRDINTNTTAKATGIIIDAADKATMIVGGARVLVELEVRALGFAERRLLSSSVSGAANSGMMGGLVEANAAQQLAKLEASNPGAHFLSRHGAGTTIEAQHIRATTGLTPDGVAGRAVDSSRFFSNQLQLQASERAMTIFRQTGNTRPVFDMGVWLVRASLVEELS